MAFFPGQGAGPAVTDVSGALVGACPLPSLLLGLCWEDDYCVLILPPERILTPNLIENALTLTP